jgi:hypothetical protein
MMGSDYWPSRRVASIISFAVFITSTLFWYERVHVRREHVAVGVRQRIARLVARGRSRLVLDDALHGNPRARRVRAEARADRLEQRMLRLVDLVRIAADAVCVGEIAGRGVEAHRLRAHAAAGDFEDLER